MYTGVHREDFVCEPALATLIAGRLDINSDTTTTINNKTFAFDIMNSSISFINACHAACAMINSGKYRHVMTIASEVENNLVDEGRTTLGLVETGSAAILDLAPADDETGFLSFNFQYFTDYVDMYYSCAGQENRSTFLNIRKNPCLHDYYINCIDKAVTQYLEKENFSKNMIKAVFPPQISQEFVERLKKILGFAPDAMVLVAKNNDYYTSSTVYSMQAAFDRNQVKKGDIGLIINVGAGIQVACALYQF
jgi:3-oxoacyl-[acyl-carrier-protein] synthase III